MSDGRTFGDVVVDASEIRVKSFLQVPHALLRRQDVLPADKLIYARLLEFGRRSTNRTEFDQAQVYPKIATISKQLGLSRETVKRGLKRLEKAGYLVVNARVGTSHLYYFFFQDWMPSEIERRAPVVEGDAPDHPEGSAHIDTGGGSERAEGRLNPAWKEEGIEEEGSLRLLQERPGVGVAGAPPPGPEYAVAEHQTAPPRPCIRAPISESPVAATALPAPLRPIDSTFLSGPVSGSSRREDDEVS